MRGPATIRSTLAGIAIAIASAAVATPGTAQERAPAPSPGPYARIVPIEPKLGEAEAFEAGYQRHLAWHRAAGDPWTWYGWSFVREAVDMEAFMEDGEYDVFGLTIEQRYELDSGAVADRWD